jgi:hypothetical protein
MATGYARASSGLIVTGATIQASHFNNEYDAILAAMHASTGHNHDGTAGGGAPIPLATGVTGQLAVTNGGTGATTASGARTALGLAIGTDVQAYHAALASIAGLTTAANKMVYTTASNTYAVTDLSAYGRTLIDDADATAARTTLGLAALAVLATVGTSQIDDDAVTYAKIQNVSATDKVLGRSTSGAGDVEEITCTSFGRSLIDDASAPTARQTLGIVDVLGYAISDETTAITAGNTKLTFRMPYAFTLTEIRASLSTASSSGVVTVDVNEGGVSVFSTLLTIDANEKTSTSAATPAVIVDSSLADDAEMTVDIDGAGTGAKGLKILLIGRKTS